VCFFVCLQGMLLLGLEVVEGLEGDEGGRFGWIREFSMPWNLISFNVSSAKLRSRAAIVRSGHSLSSRCHV
jgi:hypothetical protein